MNRKLITPVLAAVACLLLFSCSPGMKEARAMLAAADSLMDSDPQAAMYTIASIDSTAISGFNKGNRAKYILLGTQARYKCYLPVAGDTSIRETAEYYRRKGPESLYAEALIMKGAVHFENKEFIQALEDYKTAGTIIDRRGDDPLQSGLIHTRIGELYQITYVYDSLTVDRFHRALKCFLETDRTEIIMRGWLSLARVLLAFSPEEALPCISEGEALARELNDRQMLTVVKELMIGYFLTQELYQDIIRTADSISDIELEEVPGPAANILLALSTAYARTGDAEAARATAARIPEGAIDRPTREYLLSDIAVSERNWEAALKHNIRANRIADSIVSAGYGLHLREVEKQYEDSRLRERYSTMRTRYISTYMLLLAAFCAIAVAGSLLYSRNVMLKHEVEKCTDIIRSLNEEKTIIKSSTEKMPNRESINISEEMLKVTDELMEAYYKYGRTKAIAEQVKAILKNHFPEEGTMMRVRKIVDATYPGYLSHLEKTYPSLKEKDIYLIALMVCGFSTGTICALRRISESSLYVEKTRVAKKIGDGIRLSDFIAKTLQGNRQY